MYVEHYKKKLNLKKIFKEIFYVYIIAVIFVLIFNSFFIQAFKIPSNSMEPQINENTFVLVNKFNIGIKYPFSDKRMFDGTSNIKRGDIIVFLSKNYANKNIFFRCFSTIIYTLTFSFVELPKIMDKNANNIYIKRVIGLPGDSIKYNMKDGNVLVYINNILETKIINGDYKLLNENESNSPFISKMFIKKEYIVKDNEFYVLGDNRVSSFDSRIWEEGVKTKQLIGKAILKYYPTIGVLK